jgi:hypothetical protein
MSVADVANGLVALCRQGNFLGAVETYYAADIHSVEPSATAHVPAELVGIDLVRAKNHWWAKSYEVHHYTVTGPFIGEDGHFAVHFAFDVTCRNTGRREQMKEMALYWVEAHRITREEFFYTNPQTSM